MEDNSAAHLIISQEFSKMFMSRRPQERTIKNEQVTELQALKLLLQSNSSHRGANSSSGLAALNALCLVLALCSLFVWIFLGIKM